MRNAFGMLEALIALIVFSLIILVSSQTFLQVHRDLKIYKHSDSTRVSNLYLYLAKALRYSLVVQVQSHKIRFYTLNQDLFLSPSFDPLLRVCNSEKIPYKTYVDFVAIFSPGLEIIKASKWENGNLVLEKQPKCGIALPLNAPSVIQWREDQKLYLNDQVLLDGVEKFNCIDHEKFFEIEICTNFCVTRQILKPEIVYAF